MVSGDLLREARLRAGLTQAELAERTGTARSQVSRSKEAANREKDAMQLPILRRTLEQTRIREHGRRGPER